MEKWTRLKFYPCIPLGEDGRCVTSCKEHIEFSRKAASEGMVLLKNENKTLPLKKGAKIAIDAAGKSMKRVWSAIYLPIPYTYYERVKLEIAAFDGVIRDTQFGAEVELEILIARDKAQGFLDRIVDMTAGQAEGMETGQEYRAFPVSGKEPAE